MVIRMFNTFSEPEDVKAMLADKAYLEDIRGLFRGVKKVQCIKPMWIRGRRLSLRYVKVEEVEEGVSAEDALDAMSDETPDEVEEGMLPNEALGEAVSF